MLNYFIAFFVAASMEYEFTFIHTNNVDSLIYLNLVEFFETRSMPQTFHRYRFAFDHRQCSAMRQQMSYEIDSIRSLMDLHFDRGEQFRPHLEYAQWKFKVWDLLEDAFRFDGATSLVRRRLADVQLLLGEELWSDPREFLNER